MSIPKIRLVVSPDGDRRAMSKLGGSRRWLLIAAVVPVSWLRR
jgi:hypothetical protein